MEKKDLVEIFDEIFLPLNYKRKNSDWIFQNDELYKVVNLQRSYYSRSYYINYGFIIKGLELTTRTHVEERLALEDKREQQYLTDLLDMDSKILYVERCASLKKFINDIVVDYMCSINTKEDLCLNLKQRSFLGAVPIVVRKFYGLEE